MPSIQRKRGKGVNSTLSCGTFVSIFLRVSLLLLVFLNIQTFGEKIDFCFDESNGGKIGNDTILGRIVRIFAVHHLILDGQ